MLPVDVAPGGPVLTAQWRHSREPDGPTPPGGYFVSHTVFRYDRWRDLPAIGRAAERAARLWRTQPGALHLLQWVQPTKRQMGDLSVWRHEGDLHAFLELPEHQHLIATWRSRMHGTHHAWTVDTVDRRQLWDHARRLLSAPRVRHPTNGRG